MLKLMRHRLTPTLLLALGLAACETGSSNRRPAQYPPQQGPPPPGYGQPPPQGYTGPGQQPPPPQTAPNPTAPLSPVANDPINAVNIQYLRSRAQAVIKELEVALPADKRSRVNGIPLIIDDRPGEVNAFAACTKGGNSAMAISDGLLDIEAHLAMAKATDEVFGGNRTGQYIQFIARYQKPNAPVVRPAANFWDPNQQIDGRKVKRQHQLLDEQIAFVLGHELAHHYLGHLPCTAKGTGATAAEVSHVLSGVLPLFNQPNELAADINGTHNVLGAGSRHTDYKWTEGGGLLTMQFFAGLDQMSPIDIVFGFERSHPPPQIRVPVIQNAAASYRSGGQPSFPFPIPGFSL